MSIESKVADHYRHGHLEQAILEGLGKAGIERIGVDDLAAVDEFHLGWRTATAALADDLDLSPGLALLDVGSGIGGPARYFASAHGSIVQGVDLSSEYAEVATSLSRRCGLADRVTFTEGSGLALPFEDRRFDRATLIHVGMNIEAKAALFAEVRRVLKTDGRFGIYDIMRKDDRPIPYPVPWAIDATTSFVATQATYRKLLTEAGFTVAHEVDRTGLVMERWKEMGAKAAKDGQPPLGLHTLIGPAAPERLANVRRAVEEGIIVPMQLIATRA